MPQKPPNQSEMWISWLKYLLPLAAGLIASFYAIRTSVEVRLNECAHDIRALEYERDRLVQDAQRKHDRLREDIQAAVGNLRRDLDAHSARGMRGVRHPDGIVTLLEGLEHRIAFLEKQLSK